MYTAGVLLYQNKKRRKTIICFAAQILLGNEIILSVKIIDYIFVCLSDSMTGVNYLKFTSKNSKKYNFCVADNFLAIFLNSKLRFDKFRNEFIVLGFCQYFGERMKVILKFSQNGG